MSADHRKPVVAFVVLALAAAAIVGIQRADAQAGRFLAAVIGTSVRVHGTLASDIPTAGMAIRVAAFGPAFSSLDRALRGDRSEPLRVTASDVSARVAHAARGNEAVSRPSSRGAIRRDRPAPAADHGAAAGHGEHSPGRNVATAQRGAIRPESPRIMSRSATSSPGHPQRREVQAGRTDDRAGGADDRAGRAEQRDRAARRGSVRGFTSSHRPSR